jgi:hypothetical protein
MAAVTSVVEQNPESNKSPDVRKWIDQIEQARKREKDYRKEGRRIMEIYEGSKKDQTPFNILYSNTETLAPAIYGQVPRPLVVRRFTRTFAGPDPAQGDPIGKAASEASQRLLAFLMDTNSEEYDTFDSAMRDTVLDACLPGRGVMEFCYDAEIAPGIKEQNIPDQVTEECVYANPVEWQKAYFGYTRKWKDCPWIAIELFMDKTQATEEFGTTIANKITYVPETTEDTEDDTGHKTHDEEDVTDRKVALVYKIYDKKGCRIIFVSSNYTEGFLKEEEDPYKITGFYPIPRPLQLLRKTNKIVPTALYLLYENQAKELNKVTQRINRLIAACKVRGIYDASLDEIAELLKKDDNTLIAAGQASVLHRGEGIEKYIWMMPIEKVITVVQQLYVAREQIKRVIYEITGLSDIMRGVTQASETLGAQELKSQWGTLRLKSMQKEVARFARESLRIMLEMAINRFSPDTWAKVTQLPYLTQQQEQQLQMMKAAAQQQQMVQGQVDPQVTAQIQQMSSTPTWTAVLSLLKDKLAREYHIDIETNSTIDADANEDKENIAELMNAISQFMNGVAPLVQSGSLDINAAKAMLLAVVRRFEFGSEVEDYIRNMQPPKPQQDPTQDSKVAVAKIDAQVKTAEGQARMQELQLEGQLKQQEHQMKMEELQAKKAYNAMMARVQQMKAQAQIAVIEAKAAAPKTGGTSASV